MLLSASYFGEIMSQKSESIYCKVTGLEPKTFATVTKFRF